MGSLARAIDGKGHGIRRQGAYTSRMAKNPILSLFGRSPFGPLKEHMDTVERCVSLLQPYFEAIVENDRARANEVQEEIARIEDEADEQKHALRMHLPRSLFLPVERRDLLEVLRAQDNIANRAKDVAGLMRGREMQIPDPLTQLFLDYVGHSVEACKRATEAVAEVHELVEVGFRGPEVDHVLKLIDRIDRAEKQSDEIQVTLRARFREIERDVHPLEAMFLYRVIDLIGDVGDRAQRVGSRLQLMLAQ